MLKSKRLTTCLVACFITTLSCISTPSYAANEAMLDLLKILKDKGSLSQEEYDLLVNASKADTEKADAKANEVAAKVDEATKDLPKIKTKGKLEISGDDYKFRVGGRLQGDVTFGAGDVNFEGSEGGEPVTEFRRARVYLSGVLAKLWKFKFQYDFADDQGGTNPNTNGIKDAYIAYTGLKPVEIKFGHFKMPLSIEELTSSKYITFIERSQLVNGIVADTGGGRQYGLAASGYFNDMFTLAGGIYAGSANEDTAEDQSGFTGRLTFSPIHESTRAVHVGFGYNHNKSMNGGIDIDAEPEVHPGFDIAETDADDHETSTTWVAEAAGVYGPFSVQAEYAWSEAKDSPTEPDIRSRCLVYLW